ncbi:retrovirus-related pol polyprotein from transposon TNT 1-94 [Tanacetum coccineum]
MIQVRLKVPVRRIRTDNGTEFVNQTLCEYYEKKQLLLHVIPKIVPSYVFVMEKASYRLLHEKLPTYHFFHVLVHSAVPKSNDSRNLGYFVSKPLFDELLTPPPSVDHPAPEVIALIAEVVASDAAASTGDVEEYNHDLDVAHMNNNPFFGISIPENDSEASSSSMLFLLLCILLLLTQNTLPNDQGSLLDNIIRKTQKTFEPNNYKDALTQACWIEAMQEELNEFERLEVWELVPRLDKVMVITLKWIYKVKLDGNSAFVITVH